MCHIEVAHGIRGMHVAGCPPLSCTILSLRAANTHNFKGMCRITSLYGKCLSNPCSTSKRSKTWVECHILELTLNFSFYQEIIELAMVCLNLVLGLFERLKPTFSEISSELGCLPFVGARCLPCFEIQVNEMS